MRCVGTVLNNLLSIICKAIFFSALQQENLAELESNWKTNPQSSFLRLSMNPPWLHEARSEDFGFLINEKFY